ncbi:hypothetical protein [Halalkalibacter alkalisediminis]|uniref:Uncharacterized protein n=1 Tax=Halalkalibacter alkalisediminis TaxID=935616 RepID=A0ABV6NEE1_9BACI|nr:hypothetical protein [Halalkalibacter alkalisediminis]
MEKVNFAEDAITSFEELRDIIGVPHELVIKKTISMMEDQCKNFISNSPLLFLSTS